MISLYWQRFWIGLAVVIIVAITLAVTYILTIQRLQP